MKITEERKFKKKRRKYCATIINVAVIFKYSLAAQL